MHSRHRTVHVLFILQLSLMMMSGCRHEPDILAWQAGTMGTTAGFTVCNVHGADAAAVRSGVDSVLISINAQMSTWDAASEISAFNTLPAGDSIVISEEFSDVLRLAADVSLVTGGAFDVTVGPLVNWWGFGAGDRKNRVSGEIPVGIQDAVGMNKLDLSRLPRLKKTVQGQYIDVSAVAKGFGVDAVAAYLESRGYTDFLVEIGGEIVTRGEKPDGEPWVLGIDRPLDHAEPGADLAHRIIPGSAGLATSGDYRNFRMEDGHRLSHIIDPRTGYPAETGVASVTVISSSCAQADALATALMVMGAGEALDLIEMIPETEAYLIVRDENGEFTEWFSRGFYKYLLSE